MAFSYTTHLDVTSVPGPGSDRRAGADARRRRRLQGAVPPPGSRRHLPGDRRPAREGIAEGNLAAAKVTQADKHDVHHDDERPFAYYSDLRGRMRVGLGRPGGQRRGQNGGSSVESGTSITPAVGSEAAR